MTLGIIEITLIIASAALGGVLLVPPRTGRTTRHEDPPGHDTSNSIRLGDGHQIKWKGIDGITSWGGRPRKNKEAE